LLSRNVPSATRIRIRRATTDDAAALSSFAARTFAEQFGSDNTAENMALHLSRAFGESIQRREIENPSMITLVGESDGALAAFAQLRRGSAPSCVAGASPVELYRFYVDRPWQGRGVAHQMMGAVDHAAREFKGTTLWLAVWEHNPRAIAFYGKCGFVDVGSQSFVLGTDEQTDRVMARLL
jgi:ribosomal protein S18 acetylase RimI-like enzyme